MSPLPDFPRRESQRDPDTETGRDVGIFRGTESLLTLRWRRESAANSSLEAQNSLLGRENTGNFLDSGFGSALTAAKKVINSVALRANSLRIGTGNFCRLTGN
jgi:hypothetical protein